MRSLNISAVWNMHKKIAKATNKKEGLLGSLVLRPRGVGKAAWVFFHRLRMRELPHKIMGYHIPTFTNRFHPSLYYHSFH